MALLDKGNYDVIVFPTVEGVDSDGNPFIRPSTEGIPMRVEIQPQPQSGTSARRAEQDNKGFETEEIYRMRFRRGEHIELGIRGYIIWNDQKWSIDGHPNRYNGSRRTRHIDYTIIRGGSHSE